MKNYYLFLVLMMFSTLSYAQITFNGCHPLFENQDYTFTYVTTDITGRNIFETTPISGDHSCGGLGTCEFRIYWNDADSRWEFLADSGNGDFIEPYLMFSNTNPSTPNPPSLVLGTWVENTDVTESACEGNLTTDNAILTGDVQDDTTLSISENQFKDLIQLVPNPAYTYISLLDSETAIQQLEIYDISGKLVLRNLTINESINVSNLPNGMYFVKLIGTNITLIKKLIKL